MRSYIVDVFVDFVGNDDDFGMAAEDYGEGFKFLSTVDRACGVGGGAEDKGTRAGSDGGLELCWGNLEVLFDGGFDEYGRAVGHEHHLRVTYPIWCRYDNLVATVDDGKYDVAYRLLGTVADNNL